jgi:hypothetical protein
MNSPQRRLQELLDILLCGELSEPQEEQFAQLLNEHPELQTEVIEQLGVHSQLQWHCKDIGNELITGAAVAVTRERAILASRALTHFKERYIQWLAAMVLLCGTLILWKVGLSGRTEPLILAEIVSATDVTWVKNSTALNDGKQIVNGTLRNTSGNYTLRFQTGSEVEVIGPAALDIVSGQLVRLTQGQATASVPDTANRFTVTTPLVNVVDLGTQFGVSVDDQMTTGVIVFDGKVDLERLLGADAAPQRLVRGEGVKIDREGVVERLMQVSRNSEGQWRQIGHPEVSSGVIKRVWDNITPADGSTLFAYQVNYGALKEDALAYADNPHEWNGMTGDGLPKFLIGADYVMTFNDYRYMREFELTVELARPANLYVFADNRIPPPEWLQNQFEDTGVDIGLDEGKWNWVPEEFEKFNVNTTDRGGGKSIDNVFSVWRRRCEDTTPLVLGNAGEWATEGHQGRAMYGIAATPLDASENQTGINNAHQFAALENSVFFD